MLVAGCHMAVAKMTFSDCGEAEALLACQVKKAEGLEANDYCISGWQFVIGIYYVEA